MNAFVGLSIGLFILSLTGVCTAFAISIIRDSFGL